MGGIEALAKSWKPDTATADILSALKKERLVKYVSPFEILSVWWSGYTFTPIPRHPLGDRGMIAEWGCHGSCKDKLAKVPARNKGRRNRVAKAAGAHGEYATD